VFNRGGLIYSVPRQQEKVRKNIEKNGVLKIYIPRKKSEKVRKSQKKKPLPLALQVRVRGNG